MAQIVMPSETARIGEALRAIRVSRKLSLTAVADKAQISIATLSRVETDKQNIDVTLLLKLTRILGVGASEILADADGDESDAVQRKLSQMRTSERARIFISAGRDGGGAMHHRIDDLVTTLDVLRNELLTVHRSVRRGSRKK
jgi:transcriptional regulator with XRE-family HTH domain